MPELLTSVATQSVCHLFMSCSIVFLLLVFLFVYFLRLLIFLPTTNHPPIPTPHPLYFLPLLSCPFFYQFSSFSSSTSRSSSSSSASTHSSSSSVHPSAGLCSPALYSHAYNSFYFPPSKSNVTASIWTSSSNLLCLASLALSHLPSKLHLSPLSHRQPTATLLTFVFCFSCQLDIPINYCIKRCCNDKENLA